MSGHLGTIGDPGEEEDILSLLEKDGFLAGWREIETIQETDLLEAIGTKSRRRLICQWLKISTHCRQRDLKETLSFASLRRQDSDDHKKIQSGEQSSFDNLKDLPGRTLGGFHVIGKQIDFLIDNTDETVQSIDDLKNKIREHLAEAGEVTPEFQHLEFDETPEASIRTRGRTRSELIGERYRRNVSRGSRGGAEGKTIIKANLRLRRPTVDSKNNNDMSEEFRDLYHDTEHLSALTAAKVHFKWLSFIAGIVNGTVIVFVACPLTHSYLAIP